MSYNPEVLKATLAARSLNLEGLSKRLGLRTSDLKSQLDTELPKQGLLNKVAKELSVPVFTFFMSTPPEFTKSLPDYRSQTPLNSPKSKETVQALQWATSIQQAADRIGADGVANTPVFNQQNIRDIPAFANEARSFFDISTADQKNAKDEHAFYNICRSKIEKKGIYVLHASFAPEDGNGFCLSHEKYPVLVINTRKQTKGRRLFTLIHELGHALARESAISDAFATDSFVERRCNIFAAGFLMPEEVVEELLKGTLIPTKPDLDDVRRIASKLKVSQQAAVLQLELLGKVSSGSHDKWLSTVHNIGNPDFAAKGGGGGAQPQEKTKLAKYGFRVAEVFNTGLKQGLLTELEVFRITGLKPKYQRPYFDYARSMSGDQLLTEELGDE